MIIAHVYLSSFEELESTTVSFVTTVIAPGLS